MAYNFNSVPDSNDPDTGTLDHVNEQTVPAAHHDAAEGGILGVVGGAVIGGLAGGPLGAVIGAVVGGAASAAAVDVVENHHHSSGQSLDTDKAQAPDVDTPHIPTPNIAYYTAPGAFGTSLPGIFAPPVIDDNVTNADKDSASINTESL